MVRSVQPIVCTHHRHRGRPRRRCHRCSRRRRRHYHHRYNFYPFTKKVNVQMQYINKKKAF